MNRFLMILMAFGACCGGLDRILNNRFGLGEKFEEGFMYLGPLALSMPGIMCLIPALASLISRVLAPVCVFIHLDPGTFGGILAIDMGGYQLATSLAVNSAIGRFAGIIIAATFGCTVSFTIPVGMGMVPENGRGDFAMGLLVGMAVLPAGLIVGGIVAGLTLMEMVKACFPVMIMALLLCIGMYRQPEKMVEGFRAGAWGIRIVSTFGLVIGVVHYLTGIALIPDLMPLEESMPVVCSIGIVMLGSLPLVELIKRLLRCPIEWFGRRTGMNADGTTALMVGAISVTPALGMFGRMDARSRVVNGAALVCSASALAAHFGFTVAVEPDMVPALMAGKATGMICAVLAALQMTRRKGSSV